MVRTLSLSHNLTATKTLPDYIDFSYQNLVKAIGEAIDKQAAEDGSEYFTDEKVNLYTSARRNRAAPG